MTDEKLKSASQVEAILGIRKGTLYRQAREGSVPSYLVGPKRKGVRFIVEEVRGALRRHPTAA